MTISKKRERGQVDQWLYQQKRERGGKWICGSICKKEREEVRGSVTLSAKKERGGKRICDYQQKKRGGASGPVTLGAKRERGGKWICGSIFLPQDEDAICLKILQEFSTQYICCLSGYFARFAKIDG